MLDNKEYENTGTENSADGTHASKKLVDRPDRESADCDALEQLLGPHAAIDSNPAKRGRHGPNRDCRIGGLGDAGQPTPSGPPGI